MSGQATVTIGTTSWECSVASLPGELFAGLSGVASILAGTGMLFDMSSDLAGISVNTYDMLFSLDIVFMNSGGQVLGVARDVEPGKTVTFDAGEGLGARYFMEVNADEAVGVEAGNTAVIDITQEGVDLMSVLGLMMMIVMVAAGMKVVSRKS